MKHREERRTLVRAVRWSPREWERICWLARRHGVRPSSYIREAALRQKFYPAKAPRTGRTRFTEPRGIECSVRFHEKEWQRVERLAEVLNYPPARFIREASVGYSFTARVNSAAIRQLCRLGNNLNQLTKLAHTLREVDPTGRLGPLLDRVNRMLDGLL